ALSLLAFPTRRSSDLIRSACTSITTALNAMILSTPSSIHHRPKIKSSAYPVSSNQDCTRFLSRPRCVIQSSDQALMRLSRLFFRSEEHTSELQSRENL